MDNIKIFNNSEFGKLKVITIDNDIWFVGSEIADKLGYANVNKAIQDHIFDEDKKTISYKTANTEMGKALNLWGLNDYSDKKLINESGLYSLIMGSHLPKAREFKRWVTSEVLPSIRKNGGYIVGQGEMSNEELLAKALMVAQNVIADKERLLAEKQERIEQMKPKEVFADAVTTSKTSILVGEFAKILKQNGIEIGQKRLFEWLRRNGYLIKSGSDYNMPTQRSMELGLFEIKEGCRVNSCGVSVITRTPKITGKGQIYFTNKFLRKSMM